MDYNKRNKKNKTPSFSLIEILLAISILIVIFLLFARPLVSFKRASAFNQALQIVVTNLRTAQIRTMSSQDLSQWGVYFSTSSEVILFKGSTYSSTSSSNEITKLPFGVIIWSASFGTSSSETVFSRPQGNARAGAVTISYPDGSNRTMVQLDASGVVYVNNNTSQPLSNPHQDTRHVHVPLSFDIRTKSNMILTFHDSPNPDVIDTVPVSDCLVQADEFDCTQSVIVGGSEQVIRVNTHYLDAATTTLSINRDMRFNSKDVDISFDTVLIVSYSGSSSVTKGPDALVKTPEIQ